MPNREEDLNNFDEYIDVSQRFDNMLYIIAALGIVEFVRGLSILLSIYVHSNFAILYLAFCLNECLGFATIILLHIYRF